MIYAPTPPHPPPVQKLIGSCRRHISRCAALQNCTICTMMAQTAATDRCQRSAQSQSESAAAHGFPALMPRGSHLIHQERTKQILTMTAGDG